MLYLTCAIDWSRREDIQARTVKGRLSWTGRRYQAGTVRGRPNWFGSLLPELHGTSSWFISWMLEQHEDQAQSLKSSSSVESRAELKCRVEAQNAQVQNSSSADQVQCTRAVIECEAVYKSRQTSLKLRRSVGSRQTSSPYDICEKLDLTDISTSWLETSRKWSKSGASKQLEEKDRTEQAQLQTKRGEDAEVAQRQINEAEQPAEKTSSREISLVQADRAQSDQRLQNRRLTELKSNKASNALNAKGHKIYQPAGWRPAGNGAKMEPRSSSKSRKEQNELSCRQKEAQMQKFLKDRSMRQSNQLEEETSWKDQLQRNQSGQTNQFEQSTKTNLIGSN
ncbi:branched-chain-amino-acid aminotransferase 6-like [Dorcoceras hygrometricum]|uniref:Branched-chain-amino-acid aminotransferase 6-like n=1 Tax=Dorcoceras hygrometricum TaxID=472368 RepID=A0A2Z7AJX7_9LAMI|nr:branched-chain-amino-acid aminotransferase 6-like [Dorcoceras hygrometricum]